MESVQTKQTISGTDAQHEFLSALYDNRYDAIVAHLQSDNRLAEASCIRLLTLYGFKLIPNGTGLTLNEKMIQIFLENCTFSNPSLCLFVKPIIQHGELSAVEWVMKQKQCNQMDISPLLNEANPAVRNYLQQGSWKTLPQQFPSPLNSATVTPNSSGDEGGLCWPFNLLDLQKRA